MTYPASESNLIAFFEEHGIKTQTFHHEPVHTVEDAQRVRSMPVNQITGNQITGGHCKCLFVRDKKKRRGLIVMDENKKADLKSIADQLELGRLSFGSADSLYEILGVKPGSVTPFGLINAKDRYPDLVIGLDKGMLNQEYVNYHPLHNAATTTISVTDLVKFAELCGFKPKIIEI
jgi:Ala-tRNA(Pro) deacylase